MLAACSKRFSTENLVSHLGSENHTGYNHASFRAGQGKQNKPTPVGYYAAGVLSGILILGRCCFLLLFNDRPYRFSLGKFISCLLLL